MVLGNQAGSMDKSCTIRGHDPRQTTLRCLLDSHHGLEKAEVVGAQCPESTSNHDMEVAAVNLQTCSRE